jgi:hypothetical protein
MAVQPNQNCRDLPFNYSKHQRKLFSVNTYHTIVMTSFVLGGQAVSVSLHLFNTESTFLLHKQPIAGSEMEPRA